MEVVRKISEVRRLEYQLERQKDLHQRLYLLDQLVSHYAFTDVKKAQRHLQEQSRILNVHPDPDFQLNYHLYTAFHRKSVV